MRSGSALQLMPAVRATATDQSRSGALRVEPTAVAASVALRSLGSGRVWRVLWRDKGIACPTIFLAGCGATGADVNSASCVCRASAAKTRPPWLEMRSRGLRLAPVSAKGLRTPYVRRGDPIGPLTGGVTGRARAVSVAGSPGATSLPSCARGGRRERGRPVRPSTKAG
jgi:hypothetical protein